MSNMARLHMPRLGMRMSVLEAKVLSRQPISLAFKPQSRNLVTSMSKIFARSPKEVAAAVKMNPEGIFGEI